MDVREVPPLRAVAAALERVNRLFWWNHNDHFHRWILRRAPTHSGPLTALDVGCGHGELFARLQKRNFEVTGIDPDQNMVRVAAERFSGDSGTTILQTEFRDVHQSTDLITMVASLHHQELVDALMKAKALLQPGGRLLVVGLARPQSLVDLGYDIVSSVLNPLVGTVKRLRGPIVVPLDMPMIDPTESFDHIAAVARRELPGARIRRRIFFRYTLEWTKSVPAL